MEKKGTVNGVEAILWWLFMGASACFFNFYVSIGDRLRNWIAVICDA